MDVSVVSGRKRLNLKERWDGTTDLILFRNGGTPERIGRNHGGKTSGPGEPQVGRRSIVDDVPRKRTRFLGKDTVLLDTCKKPPTYPTRPLVVSPGGLFILTPPPSPTSVPQLGFLSLETGEFNLFFKTQKQTNKRFTLGSIIVNLTVGLSLVRFDFGTPGSRSKNV